MRITIAKPDEEVTKRIDSVFPIPDCFIKVTPGDVILPRKYEALAESIRNLPIYEDDTWLVSYPRTGSTWAQEMIWLLSNKLDFEGAKEILQVRCPMVELTALFGEDHFQWVSESLGNTVEYVRNMPRPRLIRSHLPWPLLPKDLAVVRPKMIYTARNPKDLCVSFYYYCQLVHALKGTFEEFCELFLADSAPMGPYWNHVLPFWEMRNDPNVLFLKYEDMNRNLPAVLQRCAGFLDVDYKVSEGDLERACEYLKFEKMQSNPAVNLDHLVKHVKQENDSEVKFIRKGKIGDWKNNLTPEMSQRFDEWIKVHFGGTDLGFDYE